MLRNDPKYHLIEKNKNKRREAIKQCSEFVFLQIIIQFGSMTQTAKYNKKISETSEKRQFNVLLIYDFEEIKIKRNQN